MIANAEQGFSGLPVTEWLDDPKGREMRLLEDFHYTSKGGAVFTAHEGMITDGKSVPRIFWAGYLGGSPYTGKGRFAALIHDQLCKQARLEPSRRARRSMRKAADKLFFEMLEHNGCGRIKTRAMYAAVRAGAMMPAILFLLVLLCLHGCSTIERTARNEFERKVGKVAAPIAERAAEDAVS